MDNIFEQASRLKLRFAIGGSTSVEQIWDTPMTTLVDYEQTLTDTCEGYTKSTRRNKRARTKAQQENELRLAIVSYVLDVREQENEAALNAAKTKETNQVILNLIQAKKMDDLASKSVEELEAMLK